MRNNIYKISVNTFSRLGGITPPDPDDWDLYFKVNVEVYNWGCALQHRHRVLMPEIRTVRTSGRKRNFLFRF